MRSRSGDGVPDAGHVDVHRVAEALRGGHLIPRLGDADTRVRDHDVEPAECLDRVADGRGESVEISGVTTGEDSLGAEVLDQPPGLGEIVLGGGIVRNARQRPGEIDADDLRTLRRQPYRVGPPPDLGRRP